MTKNVHKKFSCYLCNSSTYTERKGKVRDEAELAILECTNCGLVALSSVGHIQPGFYEDSGMHGNQLVPIDVWLRDTDWDDQRRFDRMKLMLPNKSLLDFGCGAGGFISKARQLAGNASAVELELRVRKHWEGQIKIYPNIESVQERYDLITAFHVIEHLSDPANILRQLAALLVKDGRLIVEVPSSEDVLLSLYDSSAFQHFTYWSQHLFLFNAETLRLLALSAGFNIISIEQYQRYPLSNHLYWLSNGKPGGHQKWGFIDSPELNSAYANSLAAIGKCDTLIAHLELAI